MRNLFYLLSLAVLFVVNSVTALGQLNDAIKFKITAPDGWTDETIVRLHESTTVEFDAWWDAWKMFTPNNGIPSLYSYTAEQWETTINAIPFPVKDSSMTMWMRTMLVGGTYTMEAEFQGAFDNTIRVGIKDLLTGDQYIIDNNMSFTFGVTTSPDDYERFAIYFSPIPQLSLSENAVSVVNNGATDWTCQLFEANGIELQNNLVPADSINYTALVNGDYYVVSTDAFGFIDTIPFTVYVEPVTTTDGTIADTQSEHDELSAGAEDDHLSISTDENSTVVTIETVGDQRFVHANLSIAQDITIGVYTLNGSAISNETITNAHTVEYALPYNQGALQPIIVVVMTSTEKHTFKLVY